MNASIKQWIKCKYWLTANLIESSKDEQIETVCKLIP